VSQVNWGRGNSKVLGRRTAQEVLVISEHEGGYSTRLPIRDEKQLARVIRKLKGEFTFRRPNR